MRASLAMRSEPKIRRPVRISSPSRSRNARTSAFSASSGKLSGIARRPLLNARASAALSLPLANASASAARPTPIQAPRPGALASASGSTSPSGETARRNISSRPALRPLSTHRRSEPLPAPGASAMSLTPSGSLRGFRMGGLLSYGRRSRGFLVLEPVRAALRAMRLFLSLERFLRAALQLLRQFLVEAFDAGEFRQLDVGHFLE